MLSARFAGEDVTYEDNNRLLVSALSEVEDADRGAHFLCMLALLVPEDLAAAAPGPPPVPRILRPDVPAGARLYAIEGRVDGRILRTPRGAAGFGYDPLFLHAPSGLTFAELSASSKHAVSHRGQAFRGLVDVLRWAAGVR